MRRTAAPALGARTTSAPGITLWSPEDRFSFLLLPHSSWEQKGPSNRDSTTFLTLSSCFTFNLAGNCAFTSSPDVLAFTLKSRRISYSFPFIFLHGDHDLDCYSISVWLCTSASPPLGRVFPDPSQGPKSKPPQQKCDIPFALAR